LRNYPIAAHIRFILEHIRPELRQYFFENEKDGMPFPRDKRAIVYQRAKKALDKRPFGTHYDVYRDHYEWLHHSLAPKEPSRELFRITIGGPHCTQPYFASVFNISALSFGSLSANAIRALNKGAKEGGFAHDTGEGGVSPYHLDHGGDLIWEIGSGYFGCRNHDGSFSAEKFSDRAALPARQRATLAAIPTHLAEALNATLALTPGDEGQKLAQHEIVRSIETALEARRQRIIISQTTVSTVKWAGLLLQALCTLLAISLVHSDNRATCAIALALFATGIAASVLLIECYNRPFTGEVSITPKLLQQVIAGEGPAAASP
jgi:hypothetical protein